MRTFVEFLTWKKQQIPQGYVLLQPSVLACDVILQQNSSKTLSRGSKGRIPGTLRIAGLTKAQIKSV